MPVLPAKCNSKLLFSLCRTCDEKYEQSKCQHTVTDRSLTGTWMTYELKMALSQDYKLFRIYEVLHFSEISLYDLVCKEGGLFTGHVDTVLKVNQEISGWPEWCTTEMALQQYIPEYYEREGIMLEYGNICENPGLRF